MTTEDGISRLKELLDDAKYAVFFGGAGVSTGSGIPDFRGTDGLYTAADGEYGYPPEYMLSRDCLITKPKLFFSYYRSHMLYPDARPNPAHVALARLEERGLIKAVITQNIDGLHQAAGSRRVFELHGTTARNYCESCGKTYGVEAVTATDDVPRCTHCGGIIRPDVVLYGEGLPTKTFLGAEQELFRADLLIVGGTSLTVHPAAGLAGAFGGKTVIVNLSPTPYDYKADVLIRDRVDVVLPRLV